MREDRLSCPSGDPDQGGTVAAGGGGAGELGTGGPDGEDGIERFAEIERAAHGHAAILGDERAAGAGENWSGVGEEIRESQESGENFRNFHRRPYPFK